MPKACTRGVLTLKVTVSNICRVQRFFVCVGATYLGFPFMHRFRPLNFSLCSCVPLARSSSSALRHSQLHTQQLLISGFDVPQCVLTQNCTLLNTITILKVKDFFFFFWLRPPPSVLYISCLYRPAPSCHWVHLKKPTLSQSFSTSPAAHTSRLTCHGCWVSFSLPLLVKAVTCAAVPKLCRRWQHSTKPTSFSETQENSQRQDKQFFFTGI